MAVPSDGLAEMNDSNGKRKRSQEAKSDKGFGMAWGANAPPLRKTYVNKDSDAGDMGDFGRYMAEKQRKLRLQFQADSAHKLISDLAAVDVDGQLCDSNSFGGFTADSANSKSFKKLFEGISIFVDGFTIPSHQELRTLMIKHGGRFENYFRRDHVTHVICSTLPDSKIKDPRSLSRGLPIVKPAWVVDSIAAGKILPVSSYHLERLALEDPNQRTLSTFLASKKDGTINVSLCKSADVSTLPEVEHSVSQDERGITMGLVDAAPPKSDGLLQTHLLLDDWQSLTSANDVLGQRRECDTEKDLRDQPSGQRQSIGLGLGLDLLRSSGSSHDIEPNKSGSSGVHGCVGQTRHCTLGDANFVQNYFKYSRLHFIGTWRTRYQSRYGSSMVKSQQQEEPSSDGVLGDSSNRTIMHIDMDCFFVSVVVRNRPSLSGKPVAVCHSEKTLGTAEISSSNYAARAFGIRAGMFIRDAKALCPGLEIVPYDFEGYEQVADQFYDILHKHCNMVQAISCDEAYLDVTGLGDPKHLASIIRKEIFNLTKCTASVGIAGNLLLARMATRKAKPDGQYQIEPEQVDEFLADLSVEDLPGVGWALQEKLHNQDVYKCSQLQAISKEALQRDFGSKTGDMLWCYARGIDHRQVQINQERKSIGAEVNWGVRFNSPEDAQHFLTTLCEEVSARLHSAVVCGRTLTLKLKKRKEGAGEPAKFMGCGSCDNLSKSVTLPSATDNVDVLLRVSRQIFASFHLDVREVRGVGLQVTRLEPNLGSAASRGHHQGQKGLESWLFSTSKDESVQEAIRDQGSVCRAKVGEEIKTSNYQLTDIMEDGNEEQELLDRKRTFSSAQATKEEKAYFQKSLQGSSARKKDEIQPLPPNSVQDALKSEPAPVPWGVDKRKIEESKGKWSLGKVLKGPFSGRKQQTSGKDKGKQKVVAVQMLPRVSELDCSVLASLPPEILAEINDAYAGAVTRHMSVITKPTIKNDGENVLCSSSVSGVSASTSSSTFKPISVTVERNSLPRPVEGAVSLEQPPQREFSSVDGQSNLQSRGLLEAVATKLEDEQSSSRRSCQSGDWSKKISDTKDATVIQSESMPLSLTQVDMATLEELPSRLQQDILKSLPAHRSHEMKKDGERLPFANASTGHSSFVGEVAGPRDSNLLTVPIASYSGGCKTSETLELADLWLGSPPRWVPLFKERQGAVVLQLLSECYLKCCSCENLSTVLLDLISCLRKSCLHKDSCCHNVDMEEALQFCLELFKQYLKSKVSRNLEEVFLVLRILKRLAGGNQFWTDLYNLLIPFTQAMTGESYGGMLAFQ